VAVGLDAALYAALAAALAIFGKPKAAESGLIRSSASKKALKLPSPDMMMVVVVVIDLGRLGFDDFRVEDRGKRRVW
jgi:hypothetical protein